jgi:hypothetical protein
MHVLRDVKLNNREYGKLLDELFDYFVNLSLIFVSILRFAFVVFFITEQG